MKNHREQIYVSTAELMLFIVFKLLKVFAIIVFRLEVGHQGKISPRSSATNNTELEATQPDCPTPLEQAKGDNS